ncbi:cilia- and flagella-associated protein 61 [Drosophila sulfurigaster albostrigata]|uniref:cilia- and flagella-associated protein 61 n=1 Tax=Drosophila sulfurigaster albostrigata TaxID=89887 RepID=UPI002D219346|nr:cilia- and flagella-associated protein 61 [Drosophila sulfurigaster albostrigata]
MDPEYIVRTAGRYDCDQIEILLNATTSRVIGDKLEVPTAHLFQEYQTHRLIASLHNAALNILAYAEFCIYPNIPVLSNDLWVQWLRGRFCVDLPITLMNTIFLNFCVYHKEHDEILKLLLMEVFYREHKVNFLIIFRPPNFKPQEYEELNKYGRIYFPTDFDMYTRKNLPTIIVIKRLGLMPIISFRKALPEDNDDVVEMIDVDEPQMRIDRGDYYIAELLMGAGGKLDRDKIIVTEDSGESSGSTGMMWLSENIDIEQLIINYDLEGVGNLISCTPDAPHNTVKLEVFSGEYHGLRSINTKGLDFTNRRTVTLNPVEKYKLTEQERVYAIFRYISDELKSAGTYMNSVPQTLVLTFDVPHRRSSGKKAKQQGLETAGKAFTLQNFILHPSLRMEYTYYYLSAMFSAYPDCDFCVVPIPPGIKFSPSLWALLQFFTRVPHRPNSKMSEEIFVAHRSSVYTDLGVYRLESEDLPDILSMFPHYISHKRSSETLLPDINSNLLAFDEIRVANLLEQIVEDVLDNELSEFSVWIVRCGNEGRENSTAVGFVVLRPFSNYESIYKQFYLPYEENYLTFERGEIVMLRLHPYFHMWSDEILRTVAIRTGYRELFYFQKFTDFVLPNDLAFKMMPVEPRRMKRNWFIDTNDAKCFRRPSLKVALPVINCVKDNFYLFRHNLCPSKFIGNQSPLVIVGFSEICKALLRLMVFSWNTPDFKHVNTTNCLSYLDITVIVKYGEIEAEYDYDLECEYCTNPQSCYLNNCNSCPFVTDATQRLDLRNWIHFVPGKVEHIDCKEKVICLENNCKIHYEKLLLLCDTKYGLPGHLQAKVPKGKVCDVPYNYAHINGRLDKIVLYYKILELNECKLPSKTIIIYGYTMAIYECIDFLLKHGVQPENIIYVQPLKVQAPEYLNIPVKDNNLDDILIDMITDLGITVYESTNFEDFTVYQTVYFIKTVNFRKCPQNELLSLPCNLFINFLENYLTALTEHMLIRSNIRVENREILVDENFCTNDPNIYAAGKNVAIIWKVFYQYTYTSEIEMAEKLIDILELTQETSKRETRFSKPVMFRSLLPLGYKLLKLTAPKRYLLAKLDNSYSHVMTTYRNGDFCRVRLGTNKIVEEITCISQNLMKHLYFLEYFCGKHESLLNNLCSRYRIGLITNLIGYFEEPWTEYIMHDQFVEMQMKNQSMLKSLFAKKEDLFLVLKMEEDEFEGVCKHFVEENLLKFLRAHRHEFINKFALPEDWESKR